MFANEEINLRNASNEDMDLIYEWANDRTVRENAFHTEPIPYETHISWFARIMQDEDEVLYILEKDNRPIGQIRFSIGGGGTAEIDYSIQNKLRGNGYGEKVVRLGIDRLKKERPDVKVVIAKVKPNNVSSIKCFKKNGFDKEYIKLKRELKNE